ncbi:protein of unknown function [Fervidobacterium changbaicum]|uniref:DUF4895 domain-containing protein n=1 Tax=Fervidobacterium changbaicum TaxID=310769 RepID=A0AAE5XB88_9BACT|nr:DUF4895 domain-containing protein [Fervidobacterium changbaicum]QAV33452.1 DUF4895 domain-containing protein [Fervidobacterium changbaicum]SDH15549.1 protein of unknown function [Fervidobacterium changbaicum]
MYVGPEKFKKLESIDFDSSELIAFLESKKERLDVYHRHVAVVSCHLNHTEHFSNFPFYFNFIVTPSNEKVVGISISLPMSLTPAIYKMNDFGKKEEFIRLCGELIGNTNEQWICQCGIMKLPLKTRFVAVAGDETFLNKEMFSEKVFGAESFSFAKRVNGRVLEFLEKYKDGQYKICRTIINDEGINFFVVDKKVPDEFRALYSEVISLLRKKYGLSPAKYYPISERVIGSFTLEFETMFSNAPFERVDRLLEDYERIKSDIAKYF